MPGNSVSISASTDYTLPEATQKALKDIFKSFPFDGGNGFKYYEYDWNSQSFKHNGIPHPEQLKMVFPKASIDSSDIHAQYKMRTSYIDKEFLELGIFPKLSRITNGYNICMYYNNFENLTNCINLQFQYTWAPTILDNAFVIYIGNYNNIHYFIVFHAKGFFSGLWIVSFNTANGTISQVGSYRQVLNGSYPHSRIYKYFDEANNTFKFFYIGINGFYLDGPYAGNISIVDITINLSNFSSSYSSIELPIPEYLRNNAKTFVVNCANSDYASLIYSTVKYFTYYFEDPIKTVTSQTTTDVLLVSFWDPVYKPEELKLSLVPFTLNLLNNTLTYHTPVEKKYNPLQVTPKIYKHTSGGEEFLYINPINNNYDYFINKVSVKLDDLTLLLRNFDESNFNFEVVGYKTFFDYLLYTNQHSIITVDYCYTDTCQNVYSTYYGVGGFYGHLLVTKKSDRFLFVYVPLIYKEYGSYIKTASVTYVYDVQSPLPNNYVPPSSEADVPKIARNPWFVELTHSGLERWELVSNDVTYGPIYKNSKKVYLWAKVLLNYPDNENFIINIESLFRGDGILYPRNVLLALPTLENFVPNFVGSLHSPFATGSFLFFENIKSTQPLNSNTNFTLTYLYSPDLSSFSFTANQGDNKIPVAIFSILNDQKPRLYKWFNIYGNISFFNTRRAFAPSRGFFSGSLIELPTPPNRKYKKISNFYPLFSLDFPKLFSNLYRVVTFSSYTDGKDVKVSTIKSRYIMQDSRIAVNFYFYPDAPKRYEVRGIDATGNFYFTILDQANFLFLPAHYSDFFEIGSLISINYNGVSYVYEIVDIDTFTGVIVDDSGRPWDFDVYLLMRVDSL
jgi:hypothetical protein